jgi:preprotein translocase subunit YajC
LPLIPLIAQTTPAPAETQTTTVQPGAAPPTSQGQKDVPGLLQSPLMPLLLALAVMYFFIFRSKRGKDKQRTDMLSQLKRGDRIQTIGGVIGKVFEVSDTEVVVKVDESTNTKMRFARSAIHRVLEEEKAEAK